LARLATIVVPGTHRFALCPLAKRIERDHA
jgi:hypothetical protein